MSSSKDWMGSGWRADRNNDRGNWRGSRGSWRGSRGYSGGSGGPGRGFRNFLEPQNWTLGPPLENIELDLLLLNEETPTINNVRYAASYNWLDSESPVIAVPGKAIPFYECNGSRAADLTENRISSVLGSTSQPRRTSRARQRRLLQRPKRSSLSNISH